MKKQILFLALTFVFITSTALSQRNYSFYNFQNLAQSHYFNPAFKASNKIYIGIPTGMQSFGASNSGFTYKNLFTRRSDDSLVLDPGAAISKMKDLNFARFHIYNEAIGAGARFGKNYASFSVMAKTDFSLAYPQDLIQLIFEGNGKEFLGKRANLDGFGISLNSYVEYALGFNRELNNRFTVGGRLKFLSGIANITTRKSILGITTNEENYALTIDGELDIRSAGIIGDTPFDQGNFSDIFTNFSSFKNFGMATDLGGSFKMNDKFNFTASVLDLGFIKWDENVNNYKKDYIEFSFDGVDLNEALKDTSNYFENLKDSILDIVRLEENQTAYTNALPTRIILGGTYNFNKLLSVSTTLFNDFNNRKYNPTLLVSGAFKVRNFFQVYTNYMATTNSFGNVGLGFCVKGAGVQFYLVTDNILASINPARAKVFHVSTGFNINIGRVDNDDKSPVLD